MNLFTQSEKTLLEVLKNLYHATAPHFSKCNHVQAISSKWPGYPKTATQLNEALISLQEKGYVADKGLGSKCLTESGLRAIGVIP